MFKIPILFLTYNRPNLTRKSLKEIIKINPYKIYIANDGPKNQADKIKVLEVRKIFKKIKTKIKIKTKYNNKNLGCKLSNVQAIDWFFKNEIQGIILEDDCIANKDFFLFCENLLKKYYNNKNVFCISGSNFQKKKIGKDSYYFSKYNHCWGWATWRSRWKKNDVNIKFWPKFKKSKLWNNIHYNKIEKKYWTIHFEKAYKKKIDSWAYPWTLSVWKQNGITATPNSNLVKNIGHGLDSSHSHFMNRPIKYFNNKNFNSRIEHPKKIIINKNADEFVFKNHFNGYKLVWPYNLIYLIKLIISNPLLFLSKLIAYK